MPISRDREKPEQGEERGNSRLFNDRWIERLKPPEKGQMLLWDTAQKGLALLVSPGGTKTFRSQYKLDGKWQSRTIGRFGELTTEAGENVNSAIARELARKDRAAALSGIDPNPKKRAKVVPAAEAVIPTFEEVATLFVEQYAKPRQRTWDQTERALKINCAAWLKLPITTITKAMAYTLLEGFVAEGKGPKAGVTLAWLKTMWRWAFKREIVLSPLMDAVSIEYEKNERDRVWTPEEIKAIWHAAEQLGPVSEAYMKLLVLLAPRKTALSDMRWSDLDSSTKATLWTTPFELTKTRKTAKKRTYLTPLPPIAQAIIKGLAPDGDAQPEGLVFPGRGGVALDPGTPLKNKLVSAGAPADFTYHSARHTLSTWMENAGHSEAERALVLNHSGRGSVTASYSHGYPLKLKTKLLAKWATHVERIVGAENQQAAA